MGSMESISPFAMESISQCAKCLSRGEVGGGVRTIANLPLISSGAGPLNFKASADNYTHSGIECSRTTCALVLWCEHLFCGATLSTCEMHLSTRVCAVGV